MGLGPMQGVREDGLPKTPLYHKVHRVALDHPASLYHCENSGAGPLFAASGRLQRRQQDPTSLRNSKRDQAVPSQPQASSCPSLQYRGNNAGLLCKDVVRECFEHRKQVAISPAWALVLG